MLQVYPENLAQRELILSYAMRSGFAGGVVVDYPHRYVAIPYELFMIGFTIAFFLRVHLCVCWDVLFELMTAIHTLASIPFSCSC